MKSLGQRVTSGWLLAMLFGVLSTVPVWAADGVWEKIDVPASFEDHHGVWRYPSCSGGPVPMPDGFVSAETTCSFFIRWGDPEQLVIVWDGGGACWDPNTYVFAATGMLQLP